MTCRYSHTLLIDHLTGELAGEEFAALEMHLEGCEDCRATLAAWREAFDDVSALAEPVAPPPEVKEALLARIRGEMLQPSVIPFDARAGTGVAASADTPRRWPLVIRRLGYIAAMVAGLLIGAAGTRIWWLQTGRDSAGNSSAAIAIADYRLHQALEAGMRGIEGAEWQLASFSAPPADAVADAPRRSGLLAWDAVSQQLHFYALGLPVPPAGEIYRLWLIDDENQWTRVGDLRTDGDVFQLLGTAPLSWSRVRSFIVTQESASASPTGEQAPIMLRSDL